MIIRSTVLVCLCLAAAALFGCGDDDSSRLAQAPHPLLTQRAPDKAWSQDFDPDWPAFSPLLTERAPDKAWAEGFDPSWSSFLRPKGPASCDAAPKRKAKQTDLPRLKGNVTLEAATRVFENFAQRWLVKVGRNLRHNDTNMDVAALGDGFVARFTRVAGDTLTMSVKPSTSPSCAYIGVLRYEEHRFEGQGRTRDEAVQGPFAKVGRLKITEIFRFVSGRWVN